LLDLLAGDAVPRTTILFVRVSHWVGIDDVDQGRADLGRRRLADALLAARENGDKVGEAGVLGPMARYHHTQFEMPRAGACYELALRAARELGNMTQVTTVLLHQGMYFDDLGQIADAERAYLGALAHARNTGHKIMEGGALTNLALLYRVQGQFTQSEQFAEAALTVFRQMGDTRGAAMTKGNLGDLYYEMGDRERARSHFLAVLPILDLSIPFAAGAFRGSLALIYADEGDFDTAYTYLDSGEDQVQKTHAGEFGKIRCRRGMVDLLAGDPDSARSRLAEATQIITDVGAGPDSELAQSVAELRARLARS
jgi:tetratricopeptide (TPR) repeat protein